MKVDVLAVIADQIAACARLDTITCPECNQLRQARAVIAELIEAANAVNEASYISEHVAKVGSNCELCHAFGLIEQALAKVSPQ